MVECDSHIIITALEEGPGPSLTFPPETSVISREITPLILLFLPSFQLHVLPTPLHLLKVFAFQRTQRHPFLPPLSPLLLSSPPPRATLQLITSSQPLLSPFPKLLPLFRESFLRKTCFSFLPRRPPRPRNSCYLQPLHLLFSHAALTPAAHFGQFCLSPSLRLVLVLSLCISHSIPAFVVQLADEAADKGEREHI